ncbi:IS66 family transposase [Bradyrhizobium icense]|uniref:IS66 family transposase n=1 Tax=Bradyrhizobium icense TaxID=1274631 RepID=UPI003AAA3C17
MDLRATCRRVFLSYKKSLVHFVSLVASLRRSESGASNASPDGGEYALNRVGATPCLTIRDSEKRCCLPSGASERLRQIFKKLRPPGIQLDRSTLADWAGQAAFRLRPLHERLLGKLRQRLNFSPTRRRSRVLDPGRGRTKTGQLWAYAADDRPTGRRRSARRRLCLCPRSQSRPTNRPSTGLQGLMER